jgi:hypothetical protein
MIHPCQHNPTLATPLPTSQHAAISKQKAWTSNLCFDSCIQSVHKTALEHSQTQLLQETGAHRMCPLQSSILQS